MKVTIAEACGFCYGVRRAVDMASQAETGTKTLGPIIHNPQVVARLSAQGVAPVDSLDEVGDGETVLIRSHGVGPSVYEEASRRGIRVIDATCPHVKKAQQDAKKIVEEGKNLVIIGEKAHPEVISISQWGANRAIIIDREIEAEQIPFSESLGVVVQTTFSQEQFKRIAEILKTKTNDLDVHMTICTATQQRQNAAVELAGKVDAMIVVGGRNSANTGRLAQVCREQGCPTYHIETAAELDTAAFRGMNHIGITAGASTPDWIIQEVVDIMENLQAEGTEVMSEELLDQYDYEENPKKGDVVKGTVISVNDDAAYVSIGTKAEAILPKKEIAVPAPEKASDVIHVGDELTVEIANNIKEEGSIVVSLVKMKKVEDWKEVRDAFENDQLVECVGKETNKAGLVVSIKSLRGFIPLSQGDVKFVKSLDNLVGETFQVKVIDIDEHKNRLVLSRKAVLEAEREQKRAEALQNIEEGAVLEGTVVKIMPYGAFIDLGGVEGLLHISDISWKRVSSVDAVLQVGEKLNVLVQKFDQERNRISLSLKALQKNPWIAAIEKFEVGDVVKGEVKKLLPFGAILAIDPELQGLLHVSELTEKRGAVVKDLVNIGDVMNVKIIGIDTDKKKISLSVLAIQKDEEEQEVRNYLDKQEQAEAADDAVEGE
ncbi:bifunctional 4-hydroxy-3-methylbut-2-enyl diphosphate reductase/30S ribosomal protein S1 [Megasphaera stantonii]|jgi:ribosomal protein S1/(E)-4-hydroxy-3-methyl-but-2-enyl pyrophosphate reductase|uniref:4-hydroxy-3-methylbut-2-enyl diphosphate reductase n=1 Tax=Megasphaera stantonii TaxID=2144175 RepID=A0A346B0M6_9FIRM|nr:bifunctional 4-hydroxy-3-methylbut-2-enyl diphosphate reductase/30S ribosomal protein S1 [Megasphaera stantonii]AXL21669.1 bifunctional 4-hydroxy-3-methylbut-2-enyl diphosphate reductase/30S ribosomal protein S1 [Megasphaera stantonii]